MLDLFLLFTFVIVPLIGGILALKSWHLLRYGERMPGTIVGYTLARGAPNNGTWHLPIVNFYDAFGATHSVTMSAAVQLNPAAKPRFVTVIYPKGKLREARQLQFASLWLVTLLLGSPAIVLGVIVGASLQWRILFK